MCGIIGITSAKNICNNIYACLQNLEYRGYDSSGIAITQNSEILVRKAVGKLANLAKKLETSPLSGSTGIGHTRWATHGVIDENNAHPHFTDDVALVHNGIIENYASLAKRYRYNIDAESDSDTRVILQVIHHLLRDGLSPAEIIPRVMGEIEGSYAFVCLFKSEPSKLYGARFGSPLVVGSGIDGGSYIGSDALCMANFTDNVMYINDNEWCILEKDSFSIFNVNGNEIAPNMVQHHIHQQTVNKGPYRHFMEKEIAEQPIIFHKTVREYTHASDFDRICPDVNWQDIQQLVITGCGSAHYAGIVAQYWFETLAHLPCVVDLASEYRYRQAHPRKNTCVLAVSQSGETKDTLEALKTAASIGLSTIGIVNVASSSLARVCQHCFFTNAGTEIGVASTKAFTSQLVALLMMAVRAGIQRKTLSATKTREIINALENLPILASEIINQSQSYIAVADVLQRMRTVLYIGRNTAYPIALEGALKMKEISYIHAEGYAAGELKHGPIALVDDQTAVIALAPVNNLSDADLFTKTISNLYTSTARGCTGMVICDDDAIANLKDQHLRHVWMPNNIHSATAPILYSLPVQIIAYHTALLKGTDIDQPRNLAKSVTVE